MLQAIEVEFVEPGELPIQSIARVEFTAVATILAGFAAMALSDFSMDDWFGRCNNRTIARTRITILEFVAFVFCRKYTHFC